MLPDDLDSRIRDVLDRARSLLPVERFRVATVLATELREHADAAAQIRAEALWELYGDKDVGSISKVAEQVGISKARAQAIMGPLSERPHNSNP